jgi:hypothetical protein
VVANEGAEYFDDLGFVSRGIVHKPLEGVDTADAHIEFVGAKEFNGPAEPFSDLALLVEALLRAVGGIGDVQTQHDS